MLKPLHYAGLLEHATHASAAPARVKISEVQAL